MVTVRDAAVALLVAVVGAAIVGGVASSIRAADGATAQAKLAGDLGQLLDRMRLMFEPAAGVLRASALAYKEMCVIDLASWTHYSAPLLKVRELL